MNTTIKTVKKRFISSYKRVKSTPQRFFSQSLGLQAKLALTIALLPIIVSAVWYAKHLSLEQQKMHQSYVINHDLIIEFSAIKESISALEKAQKNNTLLDSPALQNSINKKWKATRKRITLLKNRLMENVLVAQWQQVLTLSPTYNAHLVNYSALSHELQTTEKLFHRALATRLAEQRTSFSDKNYGLLALLLILVTLFIVFSLMLIRRVTHQLYTLEHTIVQLGNGKYVRNIELQGSNELEKLGQRLNWLNEALQHSHAQKDSFLRHVTHELKTPLASLSEGSSLLQDTCMGSLSGQQERIVEIMQGSVKRLNTLIDDLLSYSAASHPLNTQQKKSLVAITTDLKTHFTSQASNSSKKLIWNIGQNSAYMPYLPCKIILIQLVNNALQYADQSIRIEVYSNENTATFSIYDDGVGIDPCELANITQPFFRGQHSHNHIGSGLGLSIVAESVKHLHGSIEFNPLSPGTHVCVKVPVRGK
ncbi:two-component system, NtrC family, sensor histidine kinase GlrK [Pseudoalteromonas citrea]|uniref:histidine kinase n=2 Tax=Pseudoalteromonas citrea TaxID=43655 RepID=A0AAD4ADZ4_9GAMM|nr:HAMP domain-containing sensor histidine kinase [Pseudoalteromonas citrea]KAF7764202.1 two-component system, NtrC family, sensor histidine kinase GlrK [Pseudoalteromonas citrea]